MVVSKKIPTTTRRTCGYSGARCRSMRPATRPLIGDRAILAVGNLQRSLHISHRVSANPDTGAAIFAEQFASALGKLARPQFAFAQPLRPIGNERAMC